MGELIDGSPLFPGETEIDQLYIIQKMQGPLTMEQTALFFRNPNFKGFKFPDMSNRKESLEKKYAGMLSPAGFSFLNGLLRMNPHERLTSIECLNHEYFDGITLDSLYRSLYPQSTITNTYELTPEKKTTNNNSNKSKSLSKQLPSLGQQLKALQQQSKAIIEISERNDTRKFSRKQRERRMMEKPQEPQLSYADVVNSERPELPKEKKKRTQNKNRESNDTLSKVYRNGSEGKENREVRAPSKQSNRTRYIKTGYYHQMESTKTTPRGVSVTPDIYPMEMVEEEPFYSGNATSPHSPSKYYANDVTRHVGNVYENAKSSRTTSPTTPFFPTSPVMEDFSDFTPDYQRESTTSPGHSTSYSSSSRRKKLPPASTQMYTFSPTNATAQYFQSPSLVITGQQNQQSAQKQQYEGFIYPSSKPQRLSSATLTRTGSSTAIPIVPNSKPIKLATGLELAYAQVAKQAQQQQSQQFVKPPTRKNGRSKNQNFMTPLGMNNSHSYLYSDSRPGTSNGNLIGELLVNNAGMQFETASIGRNINDW